MRLLLFSDVHLDAQFAWMGANRDAARRRRQALRETLVRILSLASDVRADAVLCGGDLYEHERFTPDTAEFLRSQFGQLYPVPVFVSPGNHDWYGPQSIYRQVEWSSNVHIFTNVHFQPVTLSDGLTLWGAAHTAPAGTAGFLDGFHVDRGGTHVALFHGSERGWLAAQGEGKVPHAPFDPDQIELAGIHHAFLGHYHRPRDARTHTYPGNPDPLSFGEDGVRGAVVATVAPDGSVETERHAVAVTRVHEVEVDVSGCLSQQGVRDRVTEAVQGLAGVVRVGVRGEIGEDVDLRLRDLDGLAPGVDSLVMEDRGVYPAYDFNRIAEEPTVRGQFVQDVRSATHLSDEQRRKVLITGIRALSGRGDLEVF